MLRAMPLLLEEAPSMHSDQYETKMLLLVLLGQSYSNTTSMSNHSWPTNQTLATWLQARWASEKKFHLSERKARGDRSSDRSGRTPA